MMILVRSFVKEEDYSVYSKLSFTIIVAYMRASAVFHRSAGKGVAELLFGDLTKHQELRSDKMYNMLSYDLASAKHMSYLKESHLRTVWQVLQRRFSFSPLARGNDVSPAAE